MGAPGRSVCLALTLALIVAACGTSPDLGSDSSIASTTQVAPPTASTTAPTTTTTTGQITTSTTSRSPTTTTPPMESGLFCRDLHQRDFSYGDAVDYFLDEGGPDRMDADRNGIPCESVFPESEVSAYLGRLSPVIEGEIFPDALSRELIPWKGLGAGWYLVPFHGSDGWGETAPLPQRPTVLYLLNDRGTVYEIESWSGEHWIGVVDWQPGGASAVMRIGSWTEEAGWWEQIVIKDLPSLEETLLAQPSDNEFIEYRFEFTRPTGKNLLRYTDDGATSRLVRINRSGNVLAVVAEQPSSTEFPHMLEWLYKPDGTGLIIFDANGMSEVTIDGTMVRSLWNPPKMNCHPSHWWSSNELVAACYSNDPDVLPHEFFSEVWVLDLDGRTGRSISHELTAEVADLDSANQYNGAGGAWPTEGGLLVQSSADCSTAWVTRLDGLGKILGNIPGNVLVGVHDGVVVMQTWEACDGRPGGLTAVTTDGKFIRNLIVAEEPVIGVEGGIGSLASPYP